MAVAKMELYLEGAKMDHEVLIAEDLSPDFVWW